MSSVGASPEPDSSDSEPQPGSSLDLRASPRRPPRHPFQRRNLIPDVGLAASGFNESNQVQIESEDIDDGNDGHLNFEVDDEIGKYKLKLFLGSGTFSKVCVAEHVETHENVALKINRSTKNCRKTARCEVAMLRKLENIDPDGRYLWIQMLDHFQFNRHLCIAFERVGLSLFDLLKANKYTPYQLSQIKHIAYQLCFSVAALHQNKIIHADLKPENICFANHCNDFSIRLTHRGVYRIPHDTGIKLIDFGSAVNFFDPRHNKIQTRYYRAPEVVFDLGWNQAVDIWSIGCILFELYTGGVLFPAEDDDEHYRVFMDVLGPYPVTYHKTDLALKQSPENGPARKKRCCRPLRKFLEKSTKDDNDFFDLMETMLKYNAGERIILREAVNHPFFSSLTDVPRLC